MSGKKATTTIIEGDVALSVGFPGKKHPAGWKYVLLSNIAQLATGHTPSRKHPEYWNGEIPWMSVGDARHVDGKVIFETKENTNSLGIKNSAAVLLPKNTVCLSRTASIGYSVLLGKEMATSQGFVNWICSEEINPRFLQLLFLAERKFLFSISEGTAHTTIYFPEVKAFHVALPNKKEQERIVDKLDSIFAHLEIAKQGLEKIPVLLKEFRQAVLTQAVTGKLTEEWREGKELEVDHISIERHIKFDKKLWKNYISSDRWNSSKNPWLTFPAIPKKWVWYTLDEMREIDSEIVYGIVQPGPKLEEGIPYVRGTDIQNGKILLDQLMLTSREIAKKYERAALKGGDILLGIIRNTKVAKVPDSLSGGNITQGTARIRSSKFLNPDYLTILLNSPLLQSWLHSNYRGIDMPGLNLSDVRKLPVPICDVKEQTEIVRRVEALFSKADAIEAQYKKLKEQIDQLPQAILAKAFRGEV